MPTALSLDAFEDDDEMAWDLIFSDAVGAVTVSTRLTGDYLKIQTENEAVLLSAFDQLGVSYSRDDRVIDNLGGDAR